MTRSQFTKLLVISFVLLAADPGRAGDGFALDAEGWIRHWIIYGYIGELRGQLEAAPVPEHPITHEPLLLSDFIAEPPHRENRRTESNFLPGPYVEIDAAFGTVVPGHILRPEPRAGFNPDGRPMGIPWAECDCTVSLDDVFLPASFLVGDDPPFVVNGIVYTYAYIENTSGESIHAYPSFNWSHAVQFLFGAVPDDGIPSPEPGPIGFLEPVFFHGIESDFDPEACIDGSGPPLPPLPDGEARPLYVETEPLEIKPGVNLLLLKSYSTFDIGHHRFRFRHVEPPHEPITEGLRVLLSPDPDVSAPPRFRRMDVDGADGVTIADALRILFFLFGETDGSLPCPDAADIDDDGEIVALDALLVLTNLFLEPSAAQHPVAPYACCGFDPTFDTLDRFAANNSDPAADPGARDPALGSCVSPANTCQ